MTLCQLIYSHGTPTSLISACAHDCLTRLMRSVKGNVLEPLMKLVITTPEQYANLLVNELVKKRANVIC